MVSEAATGTQAVDRARRAQADLVLMDIRMPDMDCIEATRRITADEDLAGVRVLILTTFETDEFVVSALRAGASGFLGKGVNPEDLLQAVRTVASGESLLSPSATTTLIDRFLAQPEPPGVTTSPEPSPHSPALAGLTAREREITALVGAGLSNDEIGERLFISSATAKTHVNRAMMKTGSRDRAQLVVFAYENGLAGSRARG